MTCFTSPFADASWHELSAALVAGTWATPPVAARAEAAMAATATRTAMRRTGIERMEAISYSPSHPAVATAPEARAPGLRPAIVEPSRTAPDHTGPPTIARRSKIVNLAQARFRRARRRRRRTAGRPRETSGRCRGKASSGYGVAANQT